MNSLVTRAQKMAGLPRTAVISAVGALSLVAAAHPGVAWAAGSPSWHRVYASRPGHISQLQSVAAPSASDAWAAGSTKTGALLMHWNGRRWRAVPVSGAAGFYPTTVAASSPANVWLFGSVNYSATGRAMRLTKAGWVNVPLPADVTTGDVAVLGPSDVWMVGQGSCVSTGGSPAQCQTTLYRWDGATWSPYQVDALVDSVSGSGPGNLWAVGQGDPTSTYSRYKLITYKWNGTSWTPVGSMPHPLASGGEAISAASARDVWVSAFLAKGKGYQVVALHWNGKRWGRIVSPRTVPASPDVLPDGHGGVWLGPWAHWTGRRWVNVSAGRLTSGGNGVSLPGLARIPGRSALWGVGSLSPRANVFRSLIAAYGRTP